jgi:glutathione S-transferase
MGDIPVGILAYRWYMMDIRREEYGNLRRWYERLCVRPAFRAQVMIGIS